MTHRVLRYLIAILAGNAIYFAIEPHLPGFAHHQLYTLDWGLVLNFCICLICYGVIRFIR
jgi:hypothetical protein